MRGGVLAGGDSRKRLKAKAKARTVHVLFPCQHFSLVLWEYDMRMSDDEIMARAAKILERQMLHREPLTHPGAVKDYLQYKLGTREYEVFLCIFLDNRHRVIASEEMFRGSIDGASVHPREVVRRSLFHNAAAVIFSHNHPSGVAEPSQADRDITRHLRQALGLIEVRVLDHFVIGGMNVLSLAERGWL